MENTFKGWDRGFNIMVLRMAGIVCPGGFARGPDAPDTLEALTSYVEKHKQVKVSDKLCAQSIFGDEEVNMSFRAWHDWTHWRYQLPFTPEGDKACYEHQLIDMMKVYGGPSINTMQWAQMMFAEIIGHSAYKVRWGVYPDEQRAFDLAYLTNPEEAVNSGAYHTVKLDFVNLSGAAL